MYYIIIILSLILSSNISIAAPLNKFVAPPAEAPINYASPVMQQQQRLTLQPQRIPPPESLTLQQRWEQLRLKKIEDKTNKMIDKLKKKMQKLDLKTKKTWHKNFKQKYNKAQQNGEDMAKEYYQKLISVSEQLIGQEILEEKQQ
ncbi:MAG: hypothetical protein Q9M28_06450 [Mariprofundaceae bacterium]|nr:hypothetical protein [Mariprofundaceae bacterium]